MGMEPSWRKEGRGSLFAFRKTGPGFLILD